MDCLNMHCCCLSSGYSADVVRSHYLDGEDDDPLALETSVIDDTIDDSRSPPPEYNDCKCIFYKPLFQYVCCYIDSIEVMIQMTTLSR